MKNLLRLALGTLMLAGIAATAYPTAQSNPIPGEGTDPMPLCYPGTPNCKPPIPPLAAR